MWCSSNLHKYPRKFFLFMQVRLFWKWIQLFRYLFFLNSHIIYLFIYCIYCIIKTNYKSIDINECSTNNGGCDAQAVCTNAPGSFSCACKSGYQGNGFNCLGNSLFYISILFITYIYLFIYLNYFNEWKIFI